jgi:hypothetical protein
VLRVLATVRRIALEAHSVDDAIDAAVRAGRRDAALFGALAGTLAGLRFGVAGLSDARLQQLPGRGRAVLDLADRCLELGGRVPGVRA